jgi:hypothetical protein
MPTSAPTTKPSESRRRLLNLVGFEHVTIIDELDGPILKPQLEAFYGELMHFDSHPPRLPASSLAGGPATAGQPRQARHGSRDGRHERPGSRRELQPNFLGAGFA